MSASLIGSAAARRSPAPRVELAYEYLRELLLEGNLGPGDPLSVVTLSAELGCSRVPVMEALKRLERDGFVEITPQVGCRVATPRLDDVRDFFTLFAAVEGTTTAFAAARRTAADLDDFATVWAHYEAAAADAGGPHAGDPAYRRVNAAFHAAIHRMAHSPVTTGIAAGLWDRSDFYIKLAFGSLYFSQSVRRAHRAIRRAIIAGDAAAARTAVASHLESVGERVARRLARGGEAS